MKSYVNPVHVTVREGPLWTHLVKPISPWLAEVRASVLRAPDGYVRAARAKSQAHVRWAGGRIRTFGASAVLTRLELVG